MFLQELKAAYSAEGYLVAASLSGYKEVIDVAYDVPKLSANLDIMNINTYDYHGSWESRTGHLSPLYEGPPSEDLKPSYNSVSAPRNKRFSIRRQNFISEF